MNTRKLCFALCAAAFATICLHAPTVCAQSLNNGNGPAIEMETDDGSSQRKSRRTLDGVMEPVGLPAGGQIAITLVASANKAGAPVSVALLDGGESNAPSTLSVDNDGRVDFRFQAGLTPGLYRVLVTLGADQYELQLYAVAPAP